MGNEPIKEKKITIEVSETEAQILVQSLQSSSAYDKYAQLIDTQQEGEVIVGLISALSKELESKDDQKAN